MTPNKRIIVNVLATYGRSLFSLFCGLFTGRWILMALGEVDYGLYGVVGGLTAFVCMERHFQSFVRMGRRGRLPHVSYCPRKYFVNSFSPGSAKILLSDWTPFEVLGLV